MTGKVRELINQFEGFNLPNQRTQPNLTINTVAELGQGVLTTTSQELNLKIDTGSRKPEDWTSYMQETPIVEKTGVEEEDEGVSLIVDYSKSELVDADDDFDDEDWSDLKTPIEKKKLEKPADAAVALRPDHKTFQTKEDLEVILTEQFQKPEITDILYRSDSVKFRLTTNPFYKENRFEQIGGSIYLFNIRLMIDSRLPLPEDTLQQIRSIARLNGYENVHEEKATVQHCATVKSGMLQLDKIEERSSMDDLHVFLKKPPEKGDLI